MHLRSSGFITSVGVSCTLYSKTCILGRGAGRSSFRPYLLQYGVYCIEPSVQDAISGAQAHRIGFGVPRCCAARGHCVHGEQVAAHGPHTRARAVESSPGVLLSSPRCRSSSGRLPKSKQPLWQISAPAEFQSLDTSEFKFKTSRNPHLKVFIPRRQTFYYYYLFILIHIVICRLYHFARSRFGVHHFVARVLDHKLLQ